MEIQKATLGNGCFWCTEAIFQQLKGVISAKSGYSGGHVKNPSYKAVCYGDTGHAEVLQIEFDSKLILFEELLEVFWKTHDPTTLNKQGNDQGTQYRSVIFYHTEEQRISAVESKFQLDSNGIWKNQIVTEITPFDIFYPSEDDHDNYFDAHGHEPYCSFVIAPKVEKFKKEFRDKIS
ncbi:MAG: peptide-methionine (S)-S-oxide reductase MsrA [Cytophagales bacterium]|nr:peptide-methionine (S)-S-oxide reductase MsrA [Cytophagales bacterium]